MAQTVSQPLQSDSPPAAIPEPTAAEEALSQHSPEDTIAAVLLKAGLLTPEQLTYARRVRGKLSTPKTLLNVLKELRYLTNEQIQHALSAESTAVPLGALLVELGYLQQNELETALHLQKESFPRKKLGAILLEQRFVDAYKLAAVLSYQLGLPYVESQLSVLIIGRLVNPACHKLGLGMHHDPTMVLTTATEAQHLEASELLLAELEILLEDSVALAP
jgi:hypothetical protein